MEVAQVLSAYRECQDMPCISSLGERFVKLQQSTPLNMSASRYTMTRLEKVAQLYINSFEIILDFNPIYWIELALEQ